MMVSGLPELLRNDAPLLSQAAMTSHTFMSWRSGNEPPLLFSHIPHPITQIMHNFVGLEARNILIIVFQDVPVEKGSDRE